MVTTFFFFNNSVATDAASLDSSSAFTGYYAWTSSTIVSYATLGLNNPGDSADVWLQYTGNGWQDHTCSVHVVYDNNVSNSSPPQPSNPPPANNPPQPYTPPQPPAPPAPSMPMTPPQAPSVSIPSTPTNVQLVALGPSTLYITWTPNSFNESGFDITRDQHYPPEGHVSAGTYSYVWDGLPRGSYICIGVRAVNSAGASGYSNWSCTTLPS